MASQEAAGSNFAAGIPPSAAMSALSGFPGEGSPPATILPANGCIGSYCLIERIGCGGMGEVWLAEQSGPLRRRVALKLIKAGMDTGEVVARFQSERQALALMNHPAIAKVFEAGSTPQGRPYFAMEYIAGLPITQYCDEHKMSVRQRLELFIEVCEAVQHAHQKAIIHRDLKPSNILVSEVAGRPVPRIIDFGVAKAISHGLSGDAEFTRTNVIVGTPAYMSPEQAHSVGIDVDTRTDVYSLGAVLYELLVGARPLDLHNLALDEMQKRLREEESPRPSTKLRTVRDPSSVAGDRSSDPPTLARQLRGDLDAITLKAVQKERSRRYGSPAEFAADIGRYLHNQAVLAVAPSFTYRARKFMRRYRIALATAAAFVAVLTVAAIVVIRQSIRANSEAATAQAINDFLQHDLLNEADTVTQWHTFGKADPNLTVRAALDRAAARIGRRFEKQPNVEADIRETIAHTYSAMTLAPDAQKQLERVLELRRRTLGESDRKTLIVQFELASIIGAEGRYAEALASLERIFAIQRRRLGLKSEDTLKTMFDIAQMLREQGRFREAEALFARNLTMARQLFGQKDERTIAVMGALSKVYYREAKYSEAEALGKELVALHTKTLGADDLLTTVSLSDLGNVSLALGKFTEAETIYKQVLDTRRRVLGPENPTVMAAMNNLARTYASLGKLAEAEAMDTQALEMRRRILGPTYPETLMSMENLATDYRDEKKYTQAEALYAKTLDIEYRSMGIQSRFTLATLSERARMFQREGRYALASADAAKVWDVWQRQLGSQSPITTSAAVDLALAYVSQNKFCEAEPLARQAVEFDRRSLPDDWERFRAESVLGASLAGQNRNAEAEPLLLEGYQGMTARKDRIAAADHYYLDRAREWLVKFQRDNPAKSRP